MFYDVYTQLCLAKGVSRSRAASDMGLSNSTVTKWKKTGATPSGETMAKIAAYFGVSVDDLISQKNNPAPKSQVTDADIKFALFDGAPVTDAQYEEVKRFAKYIAEHDIQPKGD